ncbi:RTC4-like domain-containing protein [Lasiosphaeria hispida]|uniref:Restriction of telomere capping protein 4 n=1 Tax=Lasiosphaeria hispida TaxID=260671 RepID=A0AAJ0H5U3_9PEZI|nr:RTC4-like domain-containing protein [Lasiosphaeria hispida]
MSHKPRRAGLTASASVPPLLSCVDGKVVSKKPKPKINPERTQPENPKPKQEPAVDAPPLDFDDGPSSSSDNGLSSRGDIKKQQFNKSTKQTSSRSTSSHRASRSRSIDGKETPPSSSNQLPPPTRQRAPQGASGIWVGPRRSDRKDDLGSPRRSDKKSDLGSHFEEDIFQRLPKSKRPALGYAKRDNNTRDRSPKPQRKKAKLPSQEEMSSPRKSFRLPSEPLKLESEPDTSPKRKFSVPSTQKDSSLTDTPPRKKKMIMPTEELKAQWFPEESQRRVFMIPDLFPTEFDLDAKNTVRDREDSPRPASRWSTSSLSEIGTPSSSRPACPMCYEDVDRKVLDEFKEKHPRMTLQQEQRFCLLHRKTSAKAVWVEKGYPDIEWYALDSRITKQYDFLEGILEGGKSYFSEIYSQMVKSGQNKTLLRSEGSLTPGYYGIRGLRAMSESIIRKFSPLLRKRAVQDKLVSARGHTTYVQAVLVPELAVQLIMEDMSVNQEEARAVLMDSVWVGELLNEEVADVVMSEDESLSDLSDIEIP